MYQNIFDNGEKYYAKITFAVKILTSVFKVLFDYLDDENPRSMFGERLKFFSSGLCVKCRLPTVNNFFYS